MSVTLKLLQEKFRPDLCNVRIELFLLHGCFENVENSLTTILNCTTLAKKSYLVNHVMIFESMDLHSFSDPNWEMNCKKPRTLTERLNVSLLCSLRWVMLIFLSVLQQGFYGSWKTWKVTEFKYFSFWKPGKSWNLIVGHGKSWKIIPCVVRKLL